MAIADHGGGAAPDIDLLVGSWKRR